MRRLVRTGLFIGLLLVPLFAEAKQSMTWDFLNSNVPGDWNVTHWSPPVPGPDGLHIVAYEDGYMLHETENKFPVGVISLTFGKVTPTEAVLLWHRRGTPDSNLVQLPFSISGEQNPQIIVLNVSTYPQWDARADWIGLSLPKGADVTLQSIRLDGWSVPEKIAEAWKSFWSFDSFRAYSINFLWGPILVFNPVTRAQIWDTAPPSGWSAGRAFYAIIACAAIYLFIVWLVRRRQGGRKYALMFLTVIGALWLFFDLRMGLELMSYAKTDATRYVFAQPGKRILRSYENFHDVLFASIAALKEQPRYALIPPLNTPLISLSRYFTYPSMPLEDGEDIEGVTTWLVFRRGDVSVDQSGVLMLEGKPISPPGHIVKQFDDSTFLFRTQ